MDENIRLAACYTVFNGCELLQASIDQIYNEVDFIIICWQPVSNTGNHIARKDLVVVQGLRHIPKVHMVYFMPDQNVGTKQNERVKHQMMIDRAKELECTHFFMSATDHFYDTEEFKKCREIAKDYDLTASKMYTYYKQPYWRMDPPEQYYMPFIMKLKDDTKITSRQYDFKVDPSVRIEPVESIYLFDEQSLMMHHMSMVRIDIESKFKNSASAKNWPEKVQGLIEEFNSARVGNKISYFNNAEIIEVEDKFNISSI